MQTFFTAILGGGPAGIAAAISAKRRGVSCVILEKMPQLGKKLLASGNGRCNLSNEEIGESRYNEKARPLVREVFKRFGKEEIDRFFEGLGLILYSQDGRIFPVTNQSSSVLKVLEIEIKHLSIPVELNFDVSRIIESQDGLVLRSVSNKEVRCKNIVFAGGGKSYPSYGSDGLMYEFAAQFGHKLVQPVPAAVPISIKDNFCHLLQGQKVHANVQAIIGGSSKSTASGDLLFTKYGLSGTAILDISDEISVAINRDGRRDVDISVDLAPFADQSSLRKELKKRVGKGLLPEEMLTGILPNKFGPALKSLLISRDPSKIAASLKDMRFRASGTRGWNEAEFTAGGVGLKDVDFMTLRSKLNNKIYFAGEILDVNGKRGGYNLAWAWASGFIAGLLGS